MTKFIHKTQPIEISYLEYSKLTAVEKQDFNVVNAGTINTVGDSRSLTNNYSYSKQETTDLLGVGKVVDKTLDTAGAIVLLPVAIVAGLFSIFD